MMTVTCNSGPWAPSLLDLWESNSPPIDAYTGRCMPGHSSHAMVTPQGRLHNSQTVSSAASTTPAQCLCPACSQQPLHFRSITHVAHMLPLQAPTYRQGPQSPAALAP